MEIAAYAGKLNVVKYLVNLGATNFDDAKCAAIENEHKNIINYFS